MNKILQKCKGGVSKSLFLSLSVVLCLVAKGAWADEDSSASGSSSSKEITYVCWDGTPGYATYGYGEDPTSLFLSESERQSGDKWCCAQSNTPYVIFEASEGGKLKGYTIKTANDNESEYGRNPKTWTLFGSKDYGTAENPTWEVITTVTNDDVLQDVNFTSYEYKLEEPSTKYYRYFKWVISENKGAQAMQVSELKLDLETCPHEKDGKSTLTYIKDVAANCKWAAHKLYHCSLCDLDVKKFTGTELGPHDLEYVPSTATCQKKGYAAYYLCKTCKRMYKDENAKQDFYRSDKEKSFGYSDHHFVDGYCEYCGKGETKTSGDFQYTINKNTQEVTIVKYTGNASSVKFPSEIDGTPVTTIGAGRDESSSTIGEEQRVFPYGVPVQQVVIPSSVKKINAYAFMNASVSEITFEENMSSSKDLSIEGQAFSCSYIEKIELPARTLKIGDYAFQSCRNLKEVKLDFTPNDDAPTTIGSNIFGYPGEVDGFPDDLVISVDKSLEEGYKNMNGLSTYRDYINREITQYGDFRYSVNDGTVTITKYKGQDENVEIPASINGMKVTAIDASSFSNNRYITSVTIPASVETIGDRAFSDCRSLKNVNFAENGKLQKIGESAFKYSIIEQVTLPASVTYIGDAAFYHYKSYLKEVNMLGETPPTLNGRDVFGDSYSSSDYTIYVGSEEIAETYKSSNSWYFYKDKIQVKEGGFSTTTTITDENGSTQGCTLKPATYEREKLTYTRQFSQAGQYATICLPFSVSAQQAAEVFEGVWTFTDDDVKFITRSSDGKYTLHFSAYDEHDGLKANQPYYVKLKSNVQEVSFTNYKEESLTIEPSTLVDAKVYDETTGEVVDGITISAYGNFLNLTDGEYYTFNADGTFGKSSYVYPYRMYLAITTKNVQASAPAFFSIGIGGNGTTGINGVTNGTKATDGKVYNLSGQLINAKGDVKGLPKGIYVKNGKKFVVK